MIGASARCNSEMSVLAQANERQPGPGVQVGSFAHNTKGVSPHRKTMRCGELFLHFARQECLSCCMPCSMLRSSLKMVGVHHFLNALVQLPCNILFPYQKSKNTSHKVRVLLFGGAISKIFERLIHMLLIHRYCRSKIAIWRHRH